jgi:hypothetical protein
LRRDETPEIIISLDVAASPPRLRPPEFRQHPENDDATCKKKKKKTLVSSRPDNI